jgi:hypothetical protein
MLLSGSRRNGAADVGVTTDPLALGRRLVVHVSARVDLDRPGRMIADIGSRAPATSPLGLRVGTPENRSRRQDDGED